MTLVVKAKKSVIFKTIYEFCKTDINVEVEALDIAKRLGEFTSDDLHVLDPSLEKMNLTTNVYGITSLLKQGKIALVDFVPSSRAVSHYRRIGKYRYVKG